jgi:phosphatidylglycerol:prolipoprotein diacylglycerol transferase
MYPILFRLGDFEITSFGVMVAVAALVGIWIFDRELARSGLPPNASNAAIAGVVGGLIGAKVIWAAEFFRTAPLRDLLFSRGGLSWFGGFAGGVVTGLSMLRRYRIGVIPGLAAASPALALGHAIGRIGCFLVGDDYGRVSSLPWAVAFPKGLPPTTLRVHPTQLYEAAALTGLALGLLRWRRTAVSDRVVLGRYLVLAGTIRFAIEFVRVDRQIVGPLTLAHLWSAVVIATGLVLLGSGQPSSRRADTP